MAGGGGWWEGSHTPGPVWLFHPSKQVLLVCHLEGLAPIPMGWLNGNLSLVVCGKVTGKEPPALMTSQCEIELALGAGLQAKLLSFIFILFPNLPFHTSSCQMSKNKGEW